MTKTEEECEPWVNYTGWGMGPMLRCRIHMEPWTEDGCPVTSKPEDPEETP